ASNAPSLPDLSPADIASVRADALRMLQLESFLAEHPTFDGRGIGIAILEGDATTSEYRHPAFTRALALDGAPGPKIVDWLPDRETRWMFVPADRHIDASEQVVRVDGVVYKLPRVGRFSLGRFNLARSYYAVLWDRQTKEAWVDVNQ